MSHTPPESKNHEVPAFVTNESLGKRVLKSSALQFGGRFVFRGLKFIRTIVVAQLLFPEDVGLFALASICLGFADVFIQTGFQSAIVEKTVLERRHMDGAWTIHVIKGIFLGSIAFLLAPYVASFFDEPQLTQVLRGLSLILVLDGFVNMGAILLQKDLQFGKKLMYDFSYITSEILGVIIAAQFIPNVWALVIGALAGQVASLFFSYVFHPYRPRFTLDLSGARELFHFGKWVSLAGILTFFVSKGDGVAISKFLGVADLGYYQLAFSLALLPGVEIVRGLGSVFFPFFARLKGKPVELADSFTRISRIVLLVAIPAIAGLYAIDTLVIATFYGDEWLPIIPVLNILILYGGFKSIEYLLSPILLGTGNPKILTYATFIYGIILALVLAPLTIRHGIEGTAWSLVIAASVSTVYLGVCFYKTITLTIKQTFSILFVPLCASGIMYMGVVFVQEYIASSIILSLLIGIMIYTGLVFVLDQCTGGNIRTSLFWIRQNLRS